MHRFFSSCANSSGGLIIISDRPQVHHIKDVLRLKLKERIIIFDGESKEYLCTVEQLSDESITAKIKHMYKAAVPEGIRLTIACALPKKAKMDEIVDKLTQLGVDRIIPLETERVIVRLDEHKKMLRRIRWEKIALESAKQSQRSSLPVIDPLKGLAEIFSGEQGFDLKLIPHLSGRRRPLKEVLAGSKAKNILVLIGPEGDFSPAEINLAQKHGCISVSLGKSVLRVDTAAVAAASFIRLYENH